MPRAYVLLVEAVLPVEIVDVIVTKEYPSGLTAIRVPGLGPVTGQFVEGDLAPKNLAPVNPDLLDLPANLGIHLQIAKMSGQGLLDLDGSYDHLPGLDLGSISQPDAAGAAIGREDQVHIGSDKILASLGAQGPLKGMDRVMGATFIDGSAKTQKLLGHIGQHHR